jgi:hypothetical protein
MDPFTTMNFCHVATTGKVWVDWNNTCSTHHIQFNFAPLLLQSLSYLPAVLLLIASLHAIHRHGAMAWDVALVGWRSEYGGTVYGWEEEVAAEGLYGARFRYKFKLEDAICSHALASSEHACNQWHSSRVSAPFTGWICKFRPNTVKVLALKSSQRDWNQREVCV